LAEGQSCAATPESFSDTYAKYIENIAFNEALEDVWSRIREADKYLNEHEPWKIKDNPSKKVDIMGPIVGKLVQIGYDLQPVMPETAAGMLDQFGGGQDKAVKSGKQYFARL